MAKKAIISLFLAAAAVIPSLASAKPWQQAVSPQFAETLCVRNEKGALVPYMVVRQSYTGEVTLVFGGEAQHGLCTVTARIF